MMAHQIQFDHVNPFQEARKQSSGGQSKYGDGKFGSVKESPSYPSGLAVRYDFQDRSPSYREDIRTDDMGWDRVSHLFLSNARDWIRKTIESLTTFSRFVRYRMRSRFLEQRNRRSVKHWVLETLGSQRDRNRVESTAFWTFTQNSMRTRRMREDTRSTRADRRT